MREFKDASSQWREVAEENARIREKLCETRVKKCALKERAAEYGKKIEELEAENRNMAELLLKAQFELERLKQKRP